MKKHEIKIGAVDIGELAKFAFDIEQELSVMIKDKYGQ